MFAWDQSEIAGHGARVGKAVDLVEGRAKVQRGNRADARRRHQTTDHRIRPRPDRRRLVGGRNQRRQALQRDQQRCQRRLQVDGQGRLPQACHKRLGLSRRDARALPAHEGAHHGNQLRPLVNKGAPNRQGLAHRLLCPRHPMGRPIPAAAIGLGQRGHIAPIGFNPPLARAVHRGVTRVGDHHGMAPPFQALRHPLAFGPALQQHPQRRPGRKDPGQGLGPRRHPAREDLGAVLIHDANFTLTRVQIDGTIFHGWLLLSCASSALPFVERKRYHAGSASRFIPSRVKPGVSGSLKEESMILQSYMPRVNPKGSDV